MEHVRKAVILAAGKGTRMAGLTAETPKPMLPVAGRPMLEHVIERLRSAGIREFLIVVGYLGERIREHFAQDASVQFREQVEVNGTGRAALLGREFVAGEPFLLTFGDILAEPEDYTRLLEKLAPDTVAVLGVKYTKDPYRGAAVYERQGKVERIVEKPPIGSSTTPWNSAGFYAFRPEVFLDLERIPKSPRGEYEITTAIEQLIAAGKVVRMSAAGEGWMDVGLPEDLPAASKMVQEG